MGCDIVFEFMARGSSQDPQVPPIKDSGLDSKDFNLDNVTKILLDNQNFRKELSKYYHEHQFSQYNELTEAILNKKGIMSNMNLSELKNSTLDIKWHTSESIYNPEILLVKKFTVNGTQIHNKRYVDEDGREIFIIQNDKASLLRFNNFLRIRDNIIKDQEVLEKNEKLKEIAKNHGFKLNAQLLINYLVNSDKYTNIEELSVINEALSDYTNTDFINLSDNFSKELINKALGIANETLVDARKKKTIIIKNSDFSKLLEQYHKEIFEKYNINKKAFSKRNIDENLLKTIFEEVFQNDPNSGYHISFLNANSQTFAVRLSSSIDDVYGFTYQTIKQELREVEDNIDKSIVNHQYRGYNIYSRTLEDGSLEYYCSMDVLTSKSLAQGKRLRSIEEVKTFIDRQYNLNNSVHSSSKLGFKYANSSAENANYIEDESYHPKGSVVKSLNIVLNPSTTIDPEDYEYLHEKHLLKEVKDIFRQQIPEQFHNIFDQVIDTTEKMGVFIHLLNERIGQREKRNFENKENLTELNNILEDIRKADYKYYFIASASNSSPRSGKFLKSYKTWQYRIIPLKSGNLIEYSQAYQRPEPIIGQLNEMADTLKSKFGLNVIILDASEIPPGIPPTAKAWVKDGNIFINGTIASSTDMMHEYAHLLLGVLKATKYDYYEKILDKIRESNLSLVKRRMDKLRKIYSNLAEADLVEEVFADLFGEHISKGNIKEIFSDMEDVKQNVATSLESKFPNVAIDIFLKGGITQMFDKLNAVVIAKRIQFGDTSKYRKASRKIEELIKENQIIENCL